jgi:HAD superfamily hydrolase (TIGR02253 family)
MIKAVIFDLDNTLTDFVGVKDNSIFAAVEAMIDAGLDMTPQEAVQKVNEVYESRGIEYQQVFDTFLLEELGEIDYKILAAGIVGYRRAREGSLVLYPHIRETLVALIKEGLSLAVISDAPRLQAWLRLCYLQLHHFFDAVVTHEDTLQLKPHPAPFLLALEKLDILPGEAVMVGDWIERDIVGAKRLGLHTVFARYGDPFKDQREEADFILDDVKQLLSIIQKLNAEG